MPETTTEAFRQQCAEVILARLGPDLEIEPSDLKDLIDKEYVRTGARLRSRYRSYMAVRWRSPEARTEDKSLGRLPEKWHDWMDCPSQEGYMTAEQIAASPSHPKLLCTCDHRSREHELQRRQARHQLPDSLAHTRPNYCQPVENQSSLSLSSLNVEIQPNVMIMMTHEGIFVQAPKQQPAPSRDIGVRHKRKPVPIMSWGINSRWSPQQVA